MTAIRRPGTTSAAVLIGLGAALATAHALAPEWSRRAGLDVWNLAALEEGRRAAAEERAEVEAHAGRVAARRAASNDVVARLVAGTLDLPTAGDELLEVYRNDDGTRLIVELRHRAVPTERHRYARYAIERADWFLNDEPDRRPAVRARLEAEYRAMCVSPESPRAP
jgi:hypothetical protein